MMYGAEGAVLLFGCVQVGIGSLQIEDYCTEVHENEVMQMLRNLLGR